jgi:uncharacterized protein with PIN domain
MIRIDENATTAPICPHCEAEIRTISCQKVPISLGVRYLYYCGRCRKGLGVSQRKGFWMG